MATYATLVSLTNLIEQIQLYHTYHPTFLHEHQMQLKSLHNKVTNLQDLLEWCSLQGCNVPPDLESRIADAVVGAEDGIENYIVGDIQSRSWEELVMVNPDNFVNVHKVDTILFSKELGKVIRHVHLLKKEMIMIKEKSVLEDQVRLPNPEKTCSQESRDLDGNNNVVGFEEEVNKIMKKVIGHESKNLQVISITGMGGIGKSTLARTVCDNRSTTNYFDVRGWLIISQEFNIKKRLIDLLVEIKAVEGEFNGDKYDYHELGLKVHKHLSGRRFLIIVDDIWSVNDWAKFKSFLPDNSNGSRIILTTRLVNVAKDVGSSDIYNLEFLNENTSWNLLCRKVFLNESCPPELLVVGKKIAKNCKGLPLSLSVIGGLLSKLEKTHVCWEKISGDINTIVTTEEDERYLKVLALSYSHLPIHLKPCFLYMGIFPEDHIFDIGSLIDLWIAEGFLKRRESTKSLEEVAQNYLEDLIARNLFYVSAKGSTGKTEKVRIHDLLRDLALREAQKENFLGVARLQDPYFSMIINRVRRVGLRDSKLCDNLESECENAMNSSTSLRSLICDTAVSLPVFRVNKLLRVSESVSFMYYPKDTFQLINSRHLRILYDPKSEFELSSLQLLWNLQIIFIERVDHSVYQSLITFPIWEMPLLRKLDMLGVILPDTPVDGKSDLMLTNLQKIKSIAEFRCTESVLSKISNIKELVLLYDDEREKASHYCLNNINRLHKLQNLVLGCSEILERPTYLFQTIEFPQSLEILNLSGCRFEWQHLTTKVGSLSRLEHLTLIECNTGDEWVLDEEGTFPRLKRLEIKSYTLVRWSAESIHFPCLENLFICQMESLEEIPFDIGSIASLCSIELRGCSKSSADSARMILKEQRSFGNDGLQLLVNQKQIAGDAEEVEVEVEEDVKYALGEKERKISKGFVAFVVPFLVILGFSYVLLRNKKIGGRGQGKGKAEIENNQKKISDRTEREAGDSWFWCFDYP